MANLSYARRMVEAGNMLTPFRSPTIDIDDFYRVAWVQAVAAIDHSLHEEMLGGGVHQQAFLPGPHLTQREETPQPLSGDHPAA